MPMSTPFIQSLVVCGILPRMRRALATAILIALLLPVGAPAETPAAAPVPATDATLSQRDHERVRAAVARGEMVPLEGVLADAQRRHAGTVLEVELENDEYEIEILGDDGVIRELEYDARTGELLEVEIEED